MRNIHKYILMASTSTVVHLPVDAQVVHCAKQDSYICIWVMLDLSQPPTVSRTFEVVGTGWDIEDGRVHVGSLLDGGFVWHVLEVV